MIDPHVSIAGAHARFHAWMFDHALPFWGRRGHDGPGQGAAEHLHLDGARAKPGFKRMRVQARQIYVFSHAALLGWPNGERLARDGYDFITRCGQNPEGAWVRRLSEDGRHVLDQTNDLYDIAFVLFALGWYARLTQRQEPLDRARRTAQWLRDHMRAPQGGFYAESRRSTTTLLQNPHMHLLEAALALFETSRETLYADLAHEILDLFATRLFDRATWTLGEFFNEDWTPLPEPDGGHVEPGHHYEWIWLLGEADRLLRADHAGEMRALADFADRWGLDPETALVCDALGRDGRRRNAATRLWPQTEALKAQIALLERELITTDRAASRIARIVDNLMRHFFADCPAGAWIDHRDAQGRICVDKIPTSSFYHVFMAYAELNRLVRSRRAGL